MLTISASLQTGDIQRRIVSAARTLLGVDVAVLFGWEGGGADFPLLAFVGAPPVQETDIPARSAEPLIRRALREHSVIGIDDCRADARHPLSAFHAVLAAPLAAHGSMFGSLVAYRREPYAWRREEATLLSLLAAQCVPVLHHAQLYERVSRRASELQTLYEISHLFGAFVEREPLLEAVLTRLDGWMGACGGAAFLVERSEQGAAELRIAAAHGLSAEYVSSINQPGRVTLDPRDPHGNGPASVAVREGRPCAVGDVFIDEKFAPFRSYALSAGYRAVVSIPLRSQGHVAGCLTLYFAQRRDFSQTELDLLLAVADGVALALDRIDLAEQLVRDDVANRSFEETDRLKSAFISTVSHELRTPLTIIKGYTDLLVDEQAGSLNETQLKFLLGVQRNTGRLTELVSDLLDISQLESGHVGPSRSLIDIGELVLEAASDYERVAAERSVTIRCERAERLPPVQADAGQVRQVVNNLLSNAVKYSASEGQVYLDCVQRDKEVVVSVRDDGPGIPLEAQSRLFEKFYRVDSSTTRVVGGSGLGLAIARAIVEQHGGRIWVDSTPGAGSVFAFALPAFYLPEPAAPQKTVQALEGS